MQTTLNLLTQQSQLIEYNGVFIRIKLMSNHIFFDYLPAGEKEWKEGFLAVLECPFEGFQWVDLKGDEDPKPEGLGTRWTLEVLNA